MNRTIEGCSEIIRQTRGMPHGSLLEPLLWKTFMEILLNDSHPPRSRKREGEREKLSKVLAGIQSWEICVG